MQRKYLILAVAILIVLAVVVTLIAVNFQGWGDTLAGIGGPASITIYNALNTIPTYIASGGWPSLLLGILVFLVIIPLGVAAIVWQKDVPYMLHLQKDPNATATGGVYQNAPSQNIIPLQQPEKES